MTFGPSWDERKYRCFLIKYRMFDAKKARQCRFEEANGGTRLRNELKDAVWATNYASLTVSVLLTCKKRFAVSGDFTSDTRMSHIKINVE